MNQKVIIFIQSKQLKNWLLPLFLFAVNIILKSLYLGAQEVDIDEPFSIYHAQGSIRQLFEMLPTENNPPLFFIILHYWIKLFGIGPVSTRFLPMLFSSLVVVFIYRIGHRFFSLRHGLTAALLYTFSNLNIFHAHDTRVYSLFVLLTTASMYFFLDLHENRNKKAFVWLSICNILLPYAHFFGFLVLFLQFLLSISIKAFRNAGFRRLILSHALVSLTFLPYLYIFIMRFLHSAGGTWVPKPVLSDLWQKLWMFSNGPENMMVFLFILLAAGFWIIYSRKKIKNTELTLLSWFVFPYIGMYLISFKVPMFLDKYMIYITPGYYLCIAAAVYCIEFKKPYLNFILAVGLVLLMLVKTDLNYNHGRTPTAVVAKVKEIQKDSSLVYVCPAWAELNIAYYYDPQAFQNYGNVRSSLNKSGVYPLYTAAQIDSIKLAESTDVIYVDAWSVVCDPDSSIYKHLGRRFARKELIEGYNGYTLWHYFD